MSGKKRYGGKEWINLYSCMFLVNKIIQRLLQDYITGEINMGKVLKLQWEEWV